MKKTLVYLCAVLTIFSAIISCSGGGGGKSGGSNLPPEINANLSTLNVSDGTLSPMFDKDTTTYAVEVSNSVNSITVTPAAAADSSTITVNGISVTSGKPSSSIDLPNTGSTANKITIIVTASDNVTAKTYTVNVTRVMLSSNANLAGLVLSDGTLTPKFNPLTVTYSAEVPYAKTSMKVTPSVAGVGALVTVNGSSVPAGEASQNITLSNTGSVINPISIVVTAQDGTKKTYTVNVTRIAISSNANLSGLTVSAGTLNPAFDASIINYTLSVGNPVTALTVTPTTASSVASVSVNGSVVISESESQSVPLTVGTTEITILVTAQDGTTKTYTVNATRQALSSNANLSEIKVLKGKLQPAFASATTNYLDAPVPFSDNASPAYNDTQSASIIATVAESGATVKINGSTVTSGSAYTLNNLSIGSNATTILVTAPDGITTKSYTVDVYRAIPIFKTGAGAISGYTLDSREDGAMRKGVSWPAQRFTEDTDSITDNMTGLVWLKTLDSAKYQWGNGISYCEGLSNSYKDWRTPNVCELRSLLNYGDADGVYHWLSGNGFLNVPLSQIFTMSSTTAAINTSLMWGISLDQGYISSMSSDTTKTSSFYVWPVRGVSDRLPVTGQTVVYAANDDGAYRSGVNMPSIRFCDNGDGTMTDNMTGLVWLKNGIDAKYWSDALSYVEGLNSGSNPGNCGCTDWRLPNVNELESILDFSQSMPSSTLGSQGFTNLTNGLYWSSTTCATITNGAWMVPLRPQDRVSFAGKSLVVGRIWPVRGGK